MTTGVWTRVVSMVALPLFAAGAAFTRTTVGPCP